MITGLFHSSYTVSDVEKTIAFCHDVLELEHTRWQISDQPYLESVTGIPGASLRIGFSRAEGDNTSYEMVEYVHPKGPRARTGFGIPGSVRLCWEVDHLDAVIDRLKMANVPVLSDPFTIDSGLWKEARGAFFLDPDGILTELIEIDRNPEGSGRFLHLHHTTFTVASIDAALDIFCEKLGLTLELITSSSGRNGTDFSGLPASSIRKAYLTIPTSDHKMEFWEYSLPARPAADMATNNLGSGHLCFRVNDIHSMYLDLTSAGIEFVGKPTEITAGVNKGGFATYFKGVDDIRFELFQNPRSD